MYSLRIASFIFLSFLSLPALALDFHVAPAGNDASPGTPEQPFASLEAARDAIRAARTNGALPQGEGCTVWVHGGDYSRTAAFELTAQDSGAPDATIVYRAYEAEKPRLLGGRVLKGFSVIQDTAIQDRLAPEARTKVFQIDLKAQGITDFGEMKSRGFARPTEIAHCELFYDGHPMTLARWPNEGEWALIAGFPESAAMGDSHGGSIGKLDEGFFIADDRPSRWKNIGDVWAHGYWAYDWANSYERIASWDAAAKQIILAPPSGIYGFRTGQRLYFINILEELDQPGEWYLDRAAGMIYFWPPTGAADPAAVEVMLSLLDQPLIQLTEASHVLFLGLTLEATRANGVNITGGENCQFTGCVIRNIGDWGASVPSGKKHGFTACEIMDTGDGGVSLSGGDRQTLTPGGHFVKDCHFARQGRWSKCYVPAIMMSGVGLTASHSLIEEHPHCGILFTGNEHVMEYNEIRRVALETGDVGAIYTGRDYTYRGNKIRYNYIHDTGGVGMGSMGVYMDDCVSGTEITGNVFRNVQRAVFLGGGRDHRVENNVFVNCSPAIQLDGRGLDPSPVWHDMVTDFMKSRLTEVPEALYRERYPAINTLDAHYAGGVGVPPEGNIAARNRCAGSWVEVVWHAKPEWLRLEDNQTLESAAPEAAEETMRKLCAGGEGAPAGFKAIPLGDIGPRR